MPTANVTYEHTATGGWDLIASEGDLEITAARGWTWALNNVEASPAVGEGHQFAHDGYGVFRKSISLAQGQYFYLKGSAGDTAVVTAEIPAS